MNLAGLNVSQAGTGGEQSSPSVLGAEFVSPYQGYGWNEDGTVNTETPVDVIRRMHYAGRAQSARPIPDSVLNNIDPVVLNRLLLATGVENSIPRKVRTAVRLWFSFANKETGELRTREMPVSLVKASSVFDIEVDQEGNLKPVLVSLPDYLDKHGFYKKSALNKKSDSAKIAVPLVVAFNRVHISKSGQNYVCNGGASAFVDNGLGKQESILIDVRLTERNIRTSDFEKAVEVVCNGADLKVRSSALAYVQTAVLFALSMSENLRVYKGEQEGYMPRDLYRMFGAQLSEVYYGKSEYGTSEAAEKNLNFHALLSGTFDLATLGGAWENVPAQRIVAGEGWNIGVLNNRS